jgi:plastocyanin
MRILLALAAALAVFTLAGGAGAQSPTLFGTVGPGFQIRLAEASGSAVTKLDPGTYTIQVDDKAEIHNFHLTGPGVDQATDIEQTGTFTWTVTFVAGRYHYQCDPHASTMKGDITVGAVTLPPTSSTTTPAKQPIALAARVGPGASIALTRAGVRVKTVVAGPVVVSVADRSAKDNFHLFGPGVNRATSRLGKATATWRLTLKRGAYTYRSDGTQSLRGSFRAL